MTAAEQADDDELVPAHIGMRFEHARFRRYVPGVKVADSPPDVCRVTKVSRGSVYYRTSDGEGTRYKVYVDAFHHSVRRVLPDFPAVAGVSADQPADATQGEGDPTP